MKTFFIGGVHPSDKKISSEAAIEKLPVPKVAYISMGQHLGAPAEPIVKPGDKVKVGQLIANPKGFVSAPVHSSVFVNPLTFVIFFILFNFLIFNCELKY